MVILVGAAEIPDCHGGIDPPISSLGYRGDPLTIGTVPSPTLLAVSTTC